MLQLSLPVANSSAAVARRELTAALRRSVSSSALAVAHGVATELIRGALLCEPQPAVPIELTAAQHDGTLRLTVQDAGPKRGSPFDYPDDLTAEGVSGRLLRGLCEASGFERVNDVTIAWGEFASGRNA